MRCRRRRQIASKIASFILLSLSLSLSLSLPLSLTHIRTYKQTQFLFSLQKIVPSSAQQHYSPASPCNCVRAAWEIGSLLHFLLLVIGVCPRFRSSCICEKVKTLARNLLRIQGEEETMFKGAHNWKKISFSGAIYHCPRACEKDGKIQRDILPCCIASRTHIFHS